MFERSADIRGKGRYKMAISHSISLGQPPDLTNSLILAAHWVWERRQTAKLQNFPFSEETITETVLLDLATMHPNEISVLPFNKVQESKTGADWEWCFYDRRRTQFVRMLIQAKVLDNSDKEYTHIDRFIGNSRVRQIDRLLSTARRRRVPALYVFYNHLTNPSRIPRNACSCMGCTECWGCSAALADAVSAKLPDKSFDTLKHLSRPWICLLCPAVGSSNPLASAPNVALSALRQMEQTSREVLRDRTFDTFRIPDEPSRQPPPYFEQMERIVSVDDPVEREGILDEIAAQNPGVDGIVLLTDAPAS